MGHSLANITSTVQKHEKHFETEKCSTTNKRKQRNKQKNSKLIYISFVYSFCFIISKGYFF